jgi:hypothetical protein
MARATKPKPLKKAPEPDLEEENKSLRAKIAGKSGLQFRPVGSDDPLLIHGTF